MPLRQGVSSSISFNPTAAYIVCNEPTSAEMADPNIFQYYYGFVAHDGGWYIQRRDTSTGENRFAMGNNDYSTAWTNRVSQAYSQFDITFRSN
jgi:CobQ-like glutamine amidotransferase family enzyme